MKVYGKYKVIKDFTIDTVNANIGDIFELPWHGYQLSLLYLKPKRNKESIIIKEGFIPYPELIDPIFINRKDFSDKKLKKIAYVYFSYIQNNPKQFIPLGEKEEIS